MTWFSFSVAELAQCTRYCSTITQCLICQLPELTRRFICIVQCPVRCTHRRSMLIAGRPIDVVD
ncbi:hypothetical protein RDWZM_008147 [Blomia tropicalis]|uniref:Uncharacterized protein n=1 Tax=Blomia tropicalis TaxID=40697 RepID=A0A9Q0M0F7_BLOTA|nr:hypothetical protein RDWZM_008147 [Blomia tropicalis]